MGPPEVPGVLTAAEVAATVETIASVQRRDGMIPWFPGGHADPWNHVEAAMALDVGGYRLEAEAAYRWLAGCQRPDGAWHRYYLGGGRVEEHTLDANLTAYVATGAWHHFLVTGHVGFLEELWPVVERAVGFALDLQQPGGELTWARGADGAPLAGALLTGSSSAFGSLQCAIRTAARLGHERPDWELSAAALSTAVASRPQAFLPKHRWAMDWYYPVLTGVVTGEAAVARLARGGHRFLMRGLGTRCVSDQPWVTAAETAESALAHAVAGEEGLAHRLLAWTRHLRAPDGSYYTGMVHPRRVHFPGGERTTYSAAAVVLAADRLAGTGPAAGLFGSGDLGARSTAGSLRV